MFQVLAIPKELTGLIFGYRNMFWLYGIDNHEVYTTEGIGRRVNHFNDYEFGYLDDNNLDIEQLKRKADKIYPYRLRAVKERCNLKNTQEAETKLAQDYLAELDYFNSLVGKEIFKGVRGANKLNLDRKSVYI